MKIGISTCPNDTFAFAQLLDQKSFEHLSFEFELLDIEQLNQKLMRSEYDVAKVSFHAALYLSKEYIVLPVGAALGYGVGPLLLAKDNHHAARLPKAGDRVQCPGKWTTATLLYQLFCPTGPPPTQCVFSDIMPALLAGDADYGVVIHEGRFTYQDQGLVCAIDLGKKWEQKTNLPLPLGGIVAKRSLGDKIHRQLTCAIRQSICFARQNPTQVLPVMAQYAQTLDDAALWKHVELYVNQTTEDLGKQGRAALDALVWQAKNLGLIDEAVVLYQ